MEASTGFEPVNNGFANRPLKPLGYDANYIDLLSSNNNKGIEFTLSIFSLQSYKCDASPPIKNYINRDIHLLYSFDENKKY